MPHGGERPRARARRARWRSGRARSTTRPAATGGCRSPPAAPAASTRSTAAAWPRCCPRTATTRRPRRPRASVDNLFLVADGDSDVAFSLADTAIDAVKGQDSFERAAAAARARDAVLELHPRRGHEGLRDRRKIEDLKGKTVSIGAPNSGTEVIGLRLMEVAGLDPDKDVTRRAMGVGESTAALREGSIDAFVWSGGLPTGAITDLATTDEIVLLPLDRYVPKLNERYGEAYEESEVEEGEYPGVPAVKTIAVPNLLMVRADMDDDARPRPDQADVRPQAELAEVHPSAEKLDARGRAEGRRAASSCTRAPSATTRRRRSEPPRLATLARRRVRRARAHGGRRRAAAARASSPATRERRRRRRGRAARRRALRARLPPLGLQGARRGALPAPPTTASCWRASPPRARRVIDYYELDGRRTRERGSWVLRPSGPRASTTMAAGRDPARPPHARGRRRARAAVRATRVHLRIAVEGT